jgi:hypothetical protein
VNWTPYPKGSIRISQKEARIAARLFVAERVNRHMPWNIRTIESYLPRGYALNGAAEDSDFHPPTVENITKVLKTYAVKNP